MSTRPHALVLPFPLTGHITPLLYLSQTLAASHGFLITFVNTEHNHASFMQAKSKKRQQAKTLVHDNEESSMIKMVGLFDGLPPDTERNGPSHVEKLMQSMPLHMKPLLEELMCEINQSSTPITCVIADIFMPWIHLAAKNARVPVVLGFHVSSIAEFSLIFHIPHLISSGQLNPDGAPKESMEKVMGIPGLSNIAVANLPWVIGPRTTNVDKGLFKFLASVQAHVEQCDAILFNSYNELEKEAVEALQEKTQVKMVPVGPLLLHSESTAGESSEISVQDKVCLDWLEGKSKSSVLYIAFGTTAWLSMSEMHALALGLEASEVSFMWVIRSDSGDTAPTNCLPEGFVERTKERALFTSWAPQLLVLSHPSIGAFLTHGGWNSTLEALCMGVPMLTWPCFFDQKGNCELIVDKWKVGLPLKRCGQQVQDVENLVRTVMSSRDEGGRMRERIGILKSKARHAMATSSGASFNNLHDLMIQYHLMP